MLQPSASAGPRLLATLAILLALILPTTVRNARANDAAQAFGKHCGECHGNRAIRAWLKKEPDETKRKAWLDGVLSKHYPPSAEERALIIRHIADQKK
jgi:mono/diheme cytochrome c family protein